MKAWELKDVDELKAGKRGGLAGVGMDMEWRGGPWGKAGGKFAEDGNSEIIKSVSPRGRIL